MPKELKIRVSFDVEGDLARAFLRERKKSLATKATLGRAALVEFLNARGHKVVDTTAPWGGSRPEDENDPLGQELVYATTKA